jgi:hypothetical protein
MIENLSQNLKGTRSFQQGWQIRLCDSQGQNALEIRFSFLVSRNGFQRRAEVCAVLFQCESGKETKKTVLKQSFDPLSIATLPDGGFRLGPCELSRTASSGSIQAKGRSLSWDLSIRSRQKVTFDLVPASIRKATLSNTSISSLEADALFTGSCSLNPENAGKKIEWQQTPGVLECHTGPLTDHSWIWAHGNHFVNESGLPVPFVFEGLTLRAHLLGFLPSPNFSSFHFLFKGKTYAFHSVRDFLRIQSRHTLTEWHFQAERGDLIFRGHATVGPKNFAGLTLEDTQGSLLYCATTELCDLSIHVYRDGKLESAVRSEKSASLEIVSTKKNPYVPLLA